MRTANESGSKSAGGAAAMVPILETMESAAAGAYEIDPLRDRRRAALVDSHAAVLKKVTRKA
jgi:hypothetical protein